MKLDERLPVDHRLATVYRAAAGVGGLCLLIFGIAGSLNAVGFFSTHGHTVAGLSSNGALGLLSIVVGAILILGATIGGNIASMINMVIGGLFVLSGFVNLALLNTSLNYLAFRIPNVLFSFAFGALLMMFGMYGRVSGRLPHNNPYWLARHPGEGHAAAPRHPLGSAGGSHMLGGHG